MSRSSGTSTFSIQMGRIRLRHFLAYSTSSSTQSELAEAWDKSRMKYPAFRITEAIFFR